MNIPNIPPELLNKIENHECAAFVGSGFSALAGLPNWETLIIRLLEKCPASELGKEDKKALLGMAESGRLSDLADFVRSSLKPKTFRDILVKMLDPSDIRPTEAHKTLAAIPFSAIITTNYDHLLEDAYTKVYGGRYARSYTYTNISALGNLVAEKQFFILKAHGTVEDPDNIIFSRSDYQRVMVNAPAYRTFFSSLFATRTFLFIGYSLSDPDLTMILEDLANIFRGFCQVHYAIIPDPGRIERKLFEQRFNIEVIPYIPSTDQHPEVHDFLKAIVRHLGEEKEKQEAQKMQALATDRLVSLGQLISGIVHELNNPLTAILGFSQLLVDKAASYNAEEHKRYVDYINKEALRATDITSRLLTFARAGRPEKRPANVNEIIKTVLELRQYEQKVNNIRVNSHLTSDLPQVMADVSQFQQVFLNIIVNAEYFMKNAHGGGTLTITSERVGDIVRVSFADDGLGIAEEDSKHLFEPFFTTKRPGEGTGLGLSICYGIVTGHNGHIYATNNSEGGATFVIELPLLATVEQPETVASSPLTAKKMEGARILVVDDEKAILELIRDCLSEEGHDVDIATDARDALERLKQNMYSVILLDVRMPGMDGFALYDRIRQMDRSLALRVAFITAAALSPEVLSSVQKRGAFCLFKPFNRQELRNLVNDVLRRG
jgi:signal transduction histidine kinase/CheY-like chemotaxis protein